MKRKTHFYEPIDRTPGRLAGNNFIQRRVWVWEKWVGF